MKRNILLLSAFILLLTVSLSSCTQCGECYWVNSAGDQLGASGELCGKDYEAARGARGEGPGSEYQWVCEDSE